jgi:hypothetical protein
VAKAISRWGREATAQQIPVAEMEFVASAFEHEVLAYATTLKF